MRTSGGRGGGLGRVRTPPDEGGGGVKKGEIFADVLYGWPLNFTDFIFTDIIIHAKASSVQVMSVIIMSDNVVS